jgi:hypothetical protein
VGLRKPRQSPKGAAVMFKRKAWFTGISAVFILTLTGLNTVSAGIPSWFWNALVDHGNQSNARFDAVEAENVAQQAQIVALEAALQAVDDLAAYLEVDISDPSKPVVRIVGANLQVVNGLGSTETKNGVGNLIVGYDEAAFNGTTARAKFCSDGIYADEATCLSAAETWGDSQKSGSHYIVGGEANSYTQSGGLVVGYGNVSNAIYSSVSGGYSGTASGKLSSVSGGYSNEALGSWSSVSGGRVNDASGISSSVSGGEDNTASGDVSSVSGGEDNTASGYYASVSGGYGNKASGSRSSVSGGFSNTASGSRSSVSGGTANEASGSQSSVSGGYVVTASGDWSSVSGGYGNKASSQSSSVSGGSGNTASGDRSSVSGGSNNEASGTYDWVAGSLWEDN